MMQVDGMKVGFFVVGIDSRYLMKGSCFNFICCTGIVFFCSLVLCNKTLAMESRPMRVLSVQDKGQVFEVNSGESFLLILPNPGSGGYVVLDPPEFDPQILILHKMEKKPPSEPGRPGDKDKAPVVIFEASVRVSQ
jgi:hypothetical protein